MRVLFFLSLSFAIISCGTERNLSYLKKKNSDFTFITETSPCFGKCPVYVLTVKASGLTIYNGIKFPDTGGEIFKNLPATEIDSLRIVLAENNFFEMDSIYDDPRVTDVPSTSFHLEMGNGGEKLVKGRFNTPENFDNIAAFINRLRLRNFDLEEVN